MALAPLGELLVQKPKPLLTLELFSAFQRTPRETVETYIFTENLQSHFELILDSVAHGSGQGFWVQAEYGAGKTHFLATLAALLANTTDPLWEEADSSAVRQFRPRLQNTHLLPVVFSLRGEAAADPRTARSLMDVLLEKGFAPALQRVGLEGKIHLTPIHALMHWYDNQASPAIKSEADAFVQSQRGLSIKALREREGADSLAELLPAYFQSSGVKPDIAVSVKDRLASIYRQILEHGYTGLLVIIDEYEGWFRIRSASREMTEQDEDLLETLGYILPKQLELAVHTIVASQSSIPAKLAGGQAGDRYVRLGLLAGAGDHEYDIIAARRVRGLDPDRKPEIQDYYRYYRDAFDFARNMSENEFQDTFPFQPRCFEIVRRITARDLPTARSGILILYETLKQDELLKRNTLIRSADLVSSAHLRQDCFNQQVYKSHFQAYQRALEDLPALEMDADDRSLAEAVLTTLFLWHTAYLENPRAMSLKDLAQATLTVSDVVRAEDNVRYVLSLMQALPQIQFENDAAKFIPAGDEGIKPISLFRDAVRRVQGQKYEVAKTWTDSLFYDTTKARGIKTLFSEFIPPDTPILRTFDYRYLQYAGEIIVATRWNDDWGITSLGEDQHFRIVVMTTETTTPITPNLLHDPRIAVVLPSALSEETLRVAAEYLAWQRMTDEYKNQSGKDAETVREWLASQASTYISHLADSQLGQFRTGQIITRDNLGMSAKEAFGAASNDQRFKFIVEKLLASAYPQIPIEANLLRNVLTSSEAGKVFEGYFSSNPAQAQTTATRNYGVGLGLSSGDNPARFGPQENNRAIALIKQMLDEQQGNELRVWKLFQTLSGIPYGLPYVAIQLELLGFVRQNNPRVELTLKRDHKIKTRDGKAFARDRITAGTVNDLQWKADLYKGFDALLPAAGPTWNDTLPFARLLVSDLRATTDQHEIENENQRLNDRLGVLKSQVPKERNQLAVLERTLSAQLPDEMTRTFERLEALTQLQNGFASFYEQAQELFKTPDTLREELQELERLRELSDAAAEVAEVRRYLDAVRLRESDTALNMSKSSLQSRITLPTLAKQPHMWSALHAEFDDFKRRYRSEYQKHHRDTTKELNRLQDALASAPRLVHALKLLNSIPQLGAARGTDLSVQYQSLVAQLSPCVVTDFQSVTVDSQPVCDKCQRDLLYTSPTQAVEQFLKSLDQALQERQRDLKRETVQRVLQRGQGDALSQFLQATQAANVSSLVDVLDEDIVTLIRQLFAQDNIVATESDIWQHFLQQYGSLEERDVPDAVKKFESLLRAAFSDAKSKTEAGKTIRLTLK